MCMFYGSAFLFCYRKRITWGPKEKLLVLLMGHHMYFIHSQPQSVHLSFMLPLKQFAPRSASNKQFRLVQFLTCLYILLSILGLPKEFPLQILCVRKTCKQFLHVPLVFLRLDSAKALSFHGAADTLGQDSTSSWREAHFTLLLCI